MHAGHSSHCHQTTECLECGSPPQERLNYFTGQFLAERDFRDEQKYWLGKHRQHNRYLHGWGTVCGLRVVPHPTPECQDRFVIIEPGLALDCCGREILVREKVYVDVPKLLALSANEADSKGQHLLFSLCYDECKTEVVPALYSECGCEEARCEASRVHESFKVKVRRVDNLPKLCCCEPVGVRLKWATTINLKGATRVALDSKGQRLYVLNSANAGQIMVYDTEHFCQLLAIDVQGRGVDMAIDPKGQFLYVLRFKSAPAPGDYSLQVIQVKDAADQDLNPPVLIKFSGNMDALPLSPGPSTSPPKLAVADGRVYALDPNAQPNKKVIIWKTDINTPGTVPGNAIFSEVPTGPNPSDVAVSPDGTWLFVAETGQAPADKKITGFKVPTLNPDGQGTNYPFTILEVPALLAVSGDSQRLFVATEGSNKVRAFRIQEPTGTTAGFSEIGSGADARSDKPVALTTSPSGKWVYLLAKEVNGTKGLIRLVNIEKIEADSAHALSDPVTVVPNPQDLALDATGRRLYAAGKGIDDPHACGGVSVLEVEEDQCQEIFWRAVYGCPQCSEEICVPLAAIRDYRDGMRMTDGEINNRIRPLAPSTETLRQVILCALESGVGKQGPEGAKGVDGRSVNDVKVIFVGRGDAQFPNGASQFDAASGLLTLWIPKGTGIKDVKTHFVGPGDPNFPAGLAKFDADTGVLELWIPKGPKGDTGPAGPGLELDLTRIIALSWRHGEENVLTDAIVKVLGRNGRDTRRRGLVIGFGKALNKKGPVDVSSIADNTHVFQVWVESNTGANAEQGLLCRCAIRGDIIPVSWEPATGPRINVATEVPGPMADGIAFIPDGKAPITKLISAGSVSELYVTLKGDFVLDSDDEKARAIDAEFVRAQLPTGDRSRPSPYGIQGGLFESWFTIKQR